MAIALRTEGLDAEELAAGSLEQRLRLASGMILFAFALTHFLNHAVGLVDLESMLRVQSWRVAVTQSLPGAAVLLAALFTHVGLGLWRTSQRTSLSLPVWEWMQLGTGLLIPWLLIPHVVGTHVAHGLFGIGEDYARILSYLWPAVALYQSLTLLIVWTHGCIGLHFWLRLAPWYRRFAPLGLAIAVAVPLLGLAGFTVAGRDVARLAASQPDLPILASLRAPSDPAAFASLERLSDVMRLSYLGLLASIALAIGLRAAMDYRNRPIAISYIEGPTVRAGRGQTLLEISRANGVPHMSVCGGRARCSTCRVRILKGLETLTAPSAAEQRTLDRVAAPPGVRLACQIRPAASLIVARLLLPDARVQGLTATISGEALGVERTVAVMFVDVRGFTQVSQDKLPYDVVFILNRLFAHLGRAIENNGGWIDKYLGDGLMAVFGKETGPEEGCRQVLMAAREIDLALEIANAEIISETKRPLGIGVGIHAGPVVLGRIGHSGLSAMTVVGRTVNVASRLEALTKDEACQLIVSAAAMRLSGLSTAGYRSKSVAVRGLDEPLDVLLIESSRDLPFAEDEASRLQRAATDQDAPALGP